MKKLILLGMILSTIFANDEIKCSSGYKQYIDANKVGLEQKSNYGKNNKNIEKAAFSKSYCENITSFFTSFNLYSQSEINLIYSSCLLGIYDGVDGKTMNYDEFVSYSHSKGSACAK